MLIGEVLQVGRYARRVWARSALYFWANGELGISTVALARRMKNTQSTVIQSIAHGGGIVDKMPLVMSTELK
jgi:hypothetical protein